MKVLIQNPETLLYLESLACWSKNIEDAYDFGNSDKAIQFCASHKIAPIEVVLHWNQTPYTIKIPVGDRHPPTRRDARLFSSRAKKHKSG